MNVPAEYIIFKLNIFKKLFLFTLGACTISLLLRQKEFSAGFLMGGLLSAAIFSLLYKYALEIRGFPLAKRKTFLIARSLLISLIMGAALFIGIKKGLNTFLGTAAGLISLKIAVFAQAFQERHAGK